MGQLSFLSFLSCLGALFQSSTTAYSFWFFLSTTFPMRGWVTGLLQGCWCVGFTLCDVFFSTSPSVLLNMTVHLPVTDFFVSMVLPIIVTVVLVHHGQQEVFYAYFFDSSLRWTVNTQNYLFWMNAIYIFLESWERVDIIEKDTHVYRLDTDKDYASCHKCNGLIKAWLWNNMEPHIAAFLCFLPWEERFLNLHYLFMTGNLLVGMVVAPSRTILAPHSSWRRSLAFTNHWRLMIKWRTCMVLWQLASFLCWIPC